MRALTVVILPLSLMACTPTGGSDSGDSGDTSDSGDSGDTSSGDTSSGDTSSGDTSSGETDSDSDSSDSDSSDTGEPPEELHCDMLPPPEGNVVEVDPSDNLEQVLESLSPGDTAMLAAGTYMLGPNSYISLQTEGVTVRGATGDAQDVIIDGNWETPFGLSINASEVTITDLTLRRFYNHPIHVTPAAGASISGVELYRIRIIDPAEQAIKINTADGGSLFADQGVIACSHLELTQEGRGYVRNNCYTGGIDAHQAWGWQIRDNHIEGFWCANGLSEHGVHFWRGGRDTVIERNILVNNARGVGLGLGEDSLGRAYPDQPCGGATAQSYAETVVDNFVFADDPALFASGAGFDVGIALESACEATVVHNTVYSTSPPFSSIEYRFPTTSGVVANNLVSHNVRDRGVGGPLIDAGNLQDAPSEWFVDAAAGDLHLSADDIPPVDAADLSYTVDTDIDLEMRDATPDIGADERP